MPHARRVTVSVRDFDTRFTRTLMSKIIHVSLLRVQKCTKKSSDPQDCEDKAAVVRQNAFCFTKQTTNKTTNKHGTQYLILHSRAWVEQFARSEEEEHIPPRSAFEWNKNPFILSESKDSLLLSFVPPGLPVEQPSVRTRFFGRLKGRWRLTCSPAPDAALS